MTFRQVCGQYGLTPDALRYYEKVGVIPEVHRTESCIRDYDDAAIDEATAEAILDYRMAHGINYYDTAWGYLIGNSERVVGKLPQKYPRKSFFLAAYSKGVVYHPFYGV